MRSKITQDKEYAKKHPEYPLVLVADMGEVKESSGVSTSLRYQLRIDKANGTIDGVVRHLGMSSANCLDDEDAADYSIEAEAASLEPLLEYLQVEFPGIKLRGVIKGTSWFSRASKPRTYSFQSYEVKGVEEVYDAFDDWERDNPMEPVMVLALSFKDALGKGNHILQEKIDKARKEFLHSGSFSAHINEIFDHDGNKVYQDFVRRPDWM